MRVHLLLAAFLALPVARAQYPGSTPVPENLRPGFLNIKQQDCKAWLSVIASKDFEGRGSGQPGFQKAADFMAAQYKSFGLKPAGDNGTFFQNVPFTRNRMDPSSAITVQGSTAYFAAPGNFNFQSLGSDATIQAEPLFVRLSGADPKLEDTSILAGKIVILTGSKPGRNLRRQLFGSDAAAVLTVAPTVSSPNWNARPGTRRSQNQNVPQGNISLATAKKIAEIEKVNPEIFSATSTIQTQSGKEPIKISAKAQIEKINVPNVLAVLEGSDVTLKDEFVGMGAHLDHLGITPEGVIYYGADDDGSGSTALLAAARALSMNPQKPKRSILFMSFCGEEMGLIGSSYYVEHPVIPNDKMVCELQMDMVGRNEEGDKDKASENVDTMSLVGSKKISTELHELVLNANKHVNFRFKWEHEDVYTRSDHYMFAAKGIPIAFLFDGFHPDYHQPTDTVDKINFDKLSNAARLFYLVANDAANLDHRVKHDVGK